MAQTLLVPMRVFAAVLLLAILLASALAGTSRAQLNTLANAGSQQPSKRDQPVTFTADSVEYDRENSLVIAQGHVEAWQNDHVLRADHITFDRNTGVAAAKGNVALLEPDGQVLFADYAELTQDMKSGVSARHACDSRGERPAGSERRATHRRPDQ